MEAPDFNHIPYDGLLTIDEYQLAYQHMVDLLNDPSLVRQEIGQIALRNHDRFPVTFANVWKRSGPSHFDVI